MADLAAPSTNSSDTVIEGQKRALELALHGAPLADVLEALVLTIERQSTAGVLGSILLLDDDGAHLRHGAAPSLPAAYNAAIDGIPTGPDIGSCGTAAATGQTVVVSDVMTDPRWAAFRDLAATHGLRACWSTPIRSTTGRVLGTFALYHRTVATPTQRDLEIVSLLGPTASLIIERDREAQRRAFVEQELVRAATRQLSHIAAMFAHAPAAIAKLSGPEHVFEVANPAYLELVGGREVLGKGVATALPELDRQGFVTLLDEVRTTCKPYVGRSRLVRLQRGGALQDCYFDFVYQPIPGDDGRCESILVIAFEVTELTLARLRAEASEHALRTFVDSLPELAWTARPDGHIDYYNQRWYEYTGTTYEEMQGWGWQKVHAPEMLPVVMERWRQSLSSGEPFEMEFTLRGADGVPRWFLTRVVATRDAAGTVVRWFGTNTNIDALRASMALADEMTAQSREMEAALIEMRGAKERAEARLAELQRERNG